MPYYRAGDYYRGDHRGNYAAGGFSFGGLIKGALGVVKGAATGFLAGGPLGAIAGARAGLPLPKGRTQVGTAVIKGINVPITRALPPPPNNLQIASMAPGGGTGGITEYGPPLPPDIAMQEALRLHLGKRRRMNWANGRALARAERRIKSAVTHMTKYIRWVSPKKEGHAAPRFGKKKK